MSFIERNFFLKSFVEENFFLESFIEGDFFLGSFLEVTSFREFYGEELCDVDWIKTIKLNFIIFNILLFGSHQYGSSIDKRRVIRWP